MADELFDTLMRFHREVVKPDLDEMRNEIQSVRSEVQSARGETQSVRSEMQSMRDVMATKADLQSVRAEMATKSDLQAMRSEMVTWPVLMKFHQQIVRPEIEEVRAKLADMATRDELLTHVDGLYARFGRLDTEYHALSVAVRRIEEQLEQQTVDLGAVRSELVRINDQISQLSQRVTKLEKVLS